MEPTMLFNIWEGSIYPEPFDVAQGQPFDVAQGKPFGFAQGSALSGVERAEQASFDAAGGLAQDSPERSRGTKRVVVSEPRESNHDFAQGQPFDFAQGQPFDYAQGQCAPMLRCYRGRI